MASSATTPLKQSFSKTVGAGVSSLMSPQGKTYYILEHCVSSKFHQAGEAQKIIVDNIEIGRDPRCQVRFDENFKTVSRRHAAIVRDGDNWKLVQISATNSTLLNGQRVTSEWYLQTGDEIQLSVNGPKLRFIVPQGEKATVGSINFTQRLDLFRRQALRPYRYGMIAMAAVLGLAVGALVYMGVFVKGVSDDVHDQAALLADAIEQNKNNAAVADSLARELIHTNEAVNANAAKIIDVEKMAKNAQASARRAMRNMSPAPEAFAEVSKSIYYMMMRVNINGESLFGVSGTCFLLNDGRLVTAKHCVDMGFSRVSDMVTAYVNSLHHFQPEMVSYDFVAVSGAGDQISMSFNPTNSPWRTGHTDYETVTVSGTDESGEEVVIPIKDRGLTGADDWAYVNTDRKGGLVYDAEWSSNLASGTPLHILGFPQNVGTEEFSTTGRVTPNYSQSTVGQAGLYDGIILLGNNETDHGNSGGPVFAHRDGKPIVIGILSGSEPLGLRNGGGEGAKSKGRVVPLSAMR
ncbi:MAG: FHA domain-containing protein [Bacteroidales bacterium]|nr:FHA domain-containing protein [Bacteroidales bacterium]